MVEGIDERGVLGECDGVISGYLGTVDIGEAVIDIVARVKGANPAARYCCDPVIGDVGRGVFVRRGVPELIKERALPMADFVTPNQFELDFLSGRRTATLAEALAAIETVHALGPRVVLVTSLRLDDTPADALDLIASDGVGRFRLRTPLLPLTANGAGDLIAALFFAHHLSAARPPRRCRSRPRRCSACSAVPPTRARAKCCWSTRRRNSCIRAASSTRARSDNPGGSHAQAFRDARRVHRPALRRQSARGRARPRRARRRRRCRRSRASSTTPRPCSCLRPRIRRTGRALRIFTPARELPFAGHPTVGTAVLLALRDGGGAGREFVLEERIGPVRCVLEAGAGERGTARFTVPQLPAEVGPAPDAATIAAALALSPQEIGFDGWRPSRWSAGNPFTFVPAAGLAALARCRPDGDKFEAAFGAAGAAFVFCGETTEPGRQFHARMFAPGMGIREDPATGSAAAAFAGVIARALAPTGAMRSPSSRATRWAGRA